MSRRADYSHTSDGSSVRGSDPCLSLRHGPLPEWTIATEYPPVYGRLYDRRRRLRSQTRYSAPAYRGASGPITRSVFAIEPDQLALDPHPVRRQDAYFVGGVGRLERDRCTAAAEALQGGFLLVDQRHHDVAGVGGVVTMDQRHVAVEDAGLDHRVAAHFERVVLARAEHVGRYADGVAAGLQRLDWGTGGDPAHHGDGDRTVAIVLGNRRAGAPAERAFDDARREAAAAVAAAGREFGELDHLDGAGPVRQTADEATFFQRRDETMNSGFRAQVERILHLVEGGRHAGLLQTFIDETQKFVLFAREHLEHSPG